MNRRAFPCVAALAGLSLSVAAWAYYDEPKSGPATPPALDKETKERVSNLRKLSLAESLIQYGRSEKSATALLTAAEIMATLPPTQDLKGMEGQTGSKVEAETAESLVAEAKKLSDDEDVLALAKRVEKKAAERSRSGAQGPFTIIDQLVPNETRLIKKDFDGYTTWTLQARSGGGIEVSVNGPNVNYGPFYSTFHSIAWSDASPGRYAIRVRNPNPYPVDFRASHN